MIKFEGLTRESALELLNAPTPAIIKDYYNTPYPVSDEQIEYYQENGFIKVTKILAGDALKYARKVIQAAVLLRKEHDKRVLSEKSQYEQSFLQCGYLCFDFPAVKDVVFSERLAGIGRDLMKVKNIRLWHDQALFKEPGGRPTDVHQDSSYWPVKEPEFTTTIWMAMNDVPVEKGSLYFYPGTHKPGLREYIDIFKNPHFPDSLDPQNNVKVPLLAGDATFHSGLTFHGAGGNNTNEMREGMTIIYTKDGSHFDASDARNATHKSCNGLTDGEIINTEYTPVLA
ncbi:MAG: hypothetical protein SCALA702_16380 [Melioribacteraceae bacterium]|nr:MAG: hypothetical protein SCALA702_16380 [Melioribacteraceae bacterium]